MDNSATSPVKEEVFNAMIPYLKEEFGNPSTFYKLGRDAKKAVEEARANVAQLINADTREIIFTSGGTESDNMAIKGAALKFEDKGKHIITTEIEHPAVLRTCEFLETRGFEVTYLPVQENGIINIDDLKNAIREDTILISIMHANNEIGTIQPIEEVGKIIRKGVRLELLIHGGGQEGGLRSGTENVPGIVGFGKAAELAYEQLDENIAKLSEMRDALIEKITDRIPEAYLNGDRVNRLPNNANFRFAAIEGEGLILRLDAKGINGATGSACSSKSLKASYVLSALGLEDAEIHGSLRLSLGTENSMEDVDVVVDALEEVVAGLRRMSPLWDNENNESLELDESKFTDPDH